MKTVARDYDSPNNYTVPAGRCNIQTSVNESKYEEIHQNALFSPGKSISKKEPGNILEKQIASTLFLVHQPYSTNKEIIINVFYHPWHQHCIIWLMNMRQYISSSVCKNILLLIIKGGYISAMIFLWDIT